MSYRLVIQRRGRRPQVFRLLQPSVVIGRGKGTDLLLPDISVSRHHARVDRNGDDGYTVTDLSSQNGTKVNGEKVTAADLESGDELQIGKFMLSYEFKPARKVEGDGNLSSYSLDDERTGFLDKVSAVDGDFAHATTVLDREQLEAVRRSARLQECAKVVLIAGGGAWKVVHGGLQFGKGGIEIEGGGLGGAARISWNGSSHELCRAGGIFFVLTVNGTKVSQKKTLSPGDKFTVGKSSFLYQA